MIKLMKCHFKQETIPLHVLYAESSVTGPIAIKPRLSGLPHVVLPIGSHRF
jgi:hypothetical protein